MGPCKEVWSFSPLFHVGCYSNKAIEALLECGKAKGKPKENICALFDRWEIVEVRAQLIDRLSRDWMLDGNIKSTLLLSR